MCNDKKIIYVILGIVLFLSISCQVFNPSDGNDEPDTITSVIEEATTITNELPILEEQTSFPETETPLEKQGIPQALEACPGHKDRIVFSRDIAEEGANFEIFSIKPDGSGEIQLTNNPGHFDGYPQWSPEHCRIAFESSINSGQNDIQVINFDGSESFTAVSDGFPNTMPTWSPDGSRIAYISTRDDQDDLFVITLDGSSPIQLTNLPEDEHWPEWSPIGEQIAFKAEADGNNEIYVINADGTSLINLTNHPSADGHPTWSPDSTKIAFTSNRSAYVEIYIMNADGTNIIQVTNFGNVPSGGPQDVSWSPDGQQLAFIMENYEIFTINIDGSGLQQLTRNTIRDDDLDW